MKISIITCVTVNTPHRNDPWKEAIANYLDFADEVVVILGDKCDAACIIKEFGRPNNLKTQTIEWPYKWNWEQLPKAMNEGLRLASGDVILRMDIDYFIHEDDYKEFKKQLEDFINQDRRIGMTLKVNMLNRYQGMIKSRNPNVINGKYKTQIRFGKAENRKTDWTVPTINGSGCKKPCYMALEEQDMLLLRTWIYNYDYFFCTKEQVKEEFWRFAQAYATAFDKSWGETKEKAWEVWSNMQYGRLKKAGEKIGSHPYFIRERINNLKPEQWGHSNFNGKGS